MDLCKLTIGYAGRFCQRRIPKRVSSRMLIVRAATTLTAVICFWSVGISLAIYLLLLPLYMLPGRLGGAKSHGFKPVS